MPTVMRPIAERRYCCSCRTTKVAAAFLVAVLMTVGEVQNLKCRTPDHWRRRSEFVDVAEQCKNSTSGDRPSRAGQSSSGSGQDDDYSSDGGRGGDGDRRTGGGNRRNAENGWRNDGGGRRNGDSRRQNNREFSVMRQDFGDNSGDNDRGGYGGERGDNGGGDRGSNGGGGGSGDHDSTLCYVQQPQQQQYYSAGNNGDRQRNHRPGNTYYPSVDYDARQSNFDNRQPMRRYRRDDDITNKNHGNNKFNRRSNKAATATNSHKILVNNRFRNVTKNGGSQAKGSILDNMDACTIHCVFNQLEMLNSNSRPDKPSIVNIMTNQIKDVELKEFIQDSIDECFDTLELDSHNSKCEFSKNFAVCMESKAQRNCDDWDENAPANKNYSQDGNNQQDKRKGY